MKSDDLLSRARAEAEKQYPGGYTADQRWVNSQRRNAAIWMAEWVLAQLPDRKVVARALYEAEFKSDMGSTWPPAHPEDREWWLTRADAVLDLIRGGSRESGDSE